MPEQFTHETFISPFTWRYGSDEMRHIWSEANKRRLWRKIWVALAEAEHEAGLVTAEQAADLQAHVDDIDLERAHQIEEEIKHDLMAEVKTYAEQCKIGGGIIHLGATSMDIEDNAEVLRIRISVSLLKKRMSRLLSCIADLMEREADHVCMAFTHLQPAEPTTVGYRLASYAQDLVSDRNAIASLEYELQGKGLKGAVGTSASYSELLSGTTWTPVHLESRVMNALGLRAFGIATQTYTRHQDWHVINALAGLALTVYKMAFDLRFLQSPAVGEWAEPFGIQQVGSSAMPFKRNPINSENIDSLARYLAALPRVAWDNAAHNLLERTLDDSANRRIIFPEAFLVADELLIRATKIISGLRIDNYAIKRNLETYGIFAATERLLMAAVRAGGNRQELHEVIREQSLAAWQAIRVGQANPLAQLLDNDPRITKWIDKEYLQELLTVETYVGDAPERTKRMAGWVRIIAQKDNAGTPRPGLFTAKPLESVELSGFGEKQSGKVRDIYRMDGQRVLITTDRISAFDRILGLIPFKGQVLNQLSAWWFEKTRDIVDNHIVSVPDPNVTIAREAESLPVEVIVRGYITGVTKTSLWMMYEAGERKPYGISLPDGLQKNDPLPEPIITPTTKAEAGGHDEQLTREQIIERGIIAETLWRKIETAALALFKRGQEIARQAGLILVDTKYEFGLVDGRLTLIDEIHTPDSSRYWSLEAYKAGTIENYDKEFLREWFAARGYRGDGEPPTMPPDFTAQIAERYIEVYERLTGQAFQPAATPAAERIAHNLSVYRPIGKMENKN